MRIGHLGAFVFILSGCYTGGQTEDAGAAQPSFSVDTGADEKQLLYNLIGRWYPAAEITRLSDRTLTAKEWCEHEPAAIFLVPEKVEVRCPKGELFAAAIAETKRDKDGTVAISLRTREQGKLKLLRISARGAKATITGNPCFEGAIEYARFPEYEILAREILGGQRCAQLAAEEPVEKQ